MKTSRVTHTKTKIVIELEEWEAADLLRMLNRIKNAKAISKSEFSIREKITGRRLMIMLLGITGNKRVDTG